MSLTHTISKSKILFFYKELLKSVWLFPVICFLVVSFLTLFKVHGSSIGIYHQILYGDNVKDKNLLLNHPQGVRSDEWLVNSQLTVAQKNNGYRLRNINIGNGQDMSIALDVPFKDWSALFRPQNLSFFILPFDYAFSLKWWSLGLLLVVSVYFFVLSLLPRKRLWASLIALTVLYSPFIQWWYLSSTTLSLAFLLFAITIVINFINGDNKTIKKRVAYSLLLTYFLAAFELVLYPPFQIACIIPGGLFLIGYVLYKKNTIRRKDVLIVAGCVLAAILIFCIFILTRMEIVRAFSDTAYPGSRNILNGSQSPAEFFTNPFSALLQSSSRAAGYPTNQSEASNYILVVPFILISFGYIASGLRTKKDPLNWLFASYFCCIFIVVVKLFVPRANILSRFLLLNKVPNARFFAALGLINILSFCLLIMYTHQRPISRKISMVSVVFGLIIVIASTLKLNSAHPDYTRGLLLPVLSCAVVAGAVFLLHSKKTITIGLSLFVAMGVSTTIYIHPLYRGTDVIQNSELSKQIKAMPVNSSWVVTDSRILINFPTMANQKNYSGVYTYPQKDIWQNFDNREEELVYNRFAHVVFNTQPSTDSDGKVALAAEDFFVANVSSCNPILDKLGVDHILSVGTLVDQSCFGLEKTIVFPMVSFNIYSRK